MTGGEGENGVRRVRKSFSGKYDMYWFTSRELGEVGPLGICILW